MKVLRFLAHGSKLTSTEGKVFNVVNELVPATALAAARRKVARRAPLLSNDDANSKAIELAQETKGATAEILGSEFVYFPHDGIPTAAWKVLVHIASPRSTKNKIQEWKLYLDARSGDVLAKIDLLKKFEGRGKVFDPNPVVALNELTLEDNSSIPDAAYVQVALAGLSSKTGVLDGAFVSTKRTVKRVKKKDPQFSSSRGNSGPSRKSWSTFTLTVCSAISRALDSRTSSIIRSKRTSMDSGTTIPTIVL